MGIGQQMERWKRREEEKKKFPTILSPESSGVHRKAVGERGEAIRRAVAGTEVGIDPMHVSP